MLCDGKRGRRVGRLRRLGRQQLAIRLVVVDKGRSLFAGEEQERRVGGEGVLLCEVRYTNRMRQERELGSRGGRYLEIGSVECLKNSRKVQRRVL